MEILGQVPETVNCHTCSAVIPLAGQEGFAHVRCPQCHAVAVVPVRFGQYLLVSPIGLGGMGTVFKAVDLPLRRYCAVKILSTETGVDAEFIERFSREARAAAAVTHTNIAQVYAFGHHQGQYYLAMELLEQGSLDNRIAKAGALTEPVVLDIGKQIATGLRAALQRGLLHLDIKPANVLFNVDGDPKLVDFGLAHLQDRPKPTLHRSSTPLSPVATPAPNQSVWGTPYYAAPEKIHGHPEDFRSDIYSLGATLFHALVGRPPLESETDDGATGKQPRRPAIALKTLQPSLADATTRLIGRMLAKNPADRPGSYDEIIRDIQTILAALKKPGSAPAPAAPPGKKRSPVVIVTVSAMILIGVVVGVWLRFRPPPVTPVAPPTVKTNGPAAPVTPATSAPPAAAVAITPVLGAVDFLGDEPWAKAWVDATLEFAQGKYTEAAQRYQEIEEKLTASQAEARQWVALYRGLALMALDRNDDAKSELTGALATDTQSLTLIVLLLQTGAGHLSAPQLDNAADRQPAWAAGLIRLVVGCRLASVRQFAEAAGAFRRYAELAKTDEQAWAFYLQPVAKKWEVECAAPGEITALEKNQKFEEALEKLRAAQDQATLPFVRKALDGHEAGLQAALEKHRAEQAKAQEEAEKKRRAEEERQRQLAEADAPLLQELDRNLAAAWPRYDFPSARSQCATLQPKLQSDTGRKQLAGREALLGLLAEFKAQLVKDFSAKPYAATGLETRAPTVTGQLARATETAIFFRTPYGEISAPWDNLTPVSLAKMGDDYAATLGQAEPKETGSRRYLLLAAFCRQYGLTRPAATYAAMLEKIAPPLKEQLDAAFPQ